MSAGAAYPGSVETMQILGDAQTQKPAKQQQHQLKSVSQTIQLSPQAGPQVAGAPAFQLADGSTLVPVSEVLVNAQAPLTLPTMTTIVAAPGAAPILVPSAAQPGRIAVALLPGGLEFAQLNGAAPAGVDGAAGSVEAGAGEFFAGGADLNAVAATAPGATGGPVTATSDGTPIPLEQLKQLLSTQLEYYFSR